MASSDFSVNGQQYGTMRGDLLLTETAVNQPQPTSFKKQTGRPKDASDFTSYVGANPIQQGNTFANGNTQNAGKLTVPAACVINSAAKIDDPAPYITGTTAQVVPKTVARSGSDYIRERLACQKAQGEQHIASELGPSIFKDDTIRKPEYNKQYLAALSNPNSTVVTNVPYSTSNTTPVVAPTVAAAISTTTPYITAFTLPNMTPTTIPATANTTIPFGTTATSPLVNVTIPAVSAAIPAVSTTIPKITQLTSTNASTVYAVTPTNLTLTLVAAPSPVLAAGQIVTIGGTTPTNMNGVYTVQTTTSSSTLVLDNPRGVTTGVTGTVYTTNVGVVMTATPNTSNTGITVQSATGIAPLRPIVFDTTSNGVLTSTMYYVGAGYVSGSLTVPLSTTADGLTLLTTSGAATTGLTIAGKVYSASSPVTVAGTLASASVVLVSAPSGLTALSPIVFNTTINGITLNTPYFVSSGYSSGTTVALATNSIGTSPLSVTSSFTGTTGSLTIDSAYLATSNVVTANVAATTDLAIGSIVNLESGTLTGVVTVSAVNTTNKTITFTYGSIIISGTVAISSTVKSYFKTSGGIVTLNVASTSVLYVGSLISIASIVKSTTTTTDLQGSFILTAVDSVNNTISFVSAAALGNITTAGAITVTGTPIMTPSTTISRSTQFTLTTGTPYNATSSTITLTITNSFVPGQTLALTGTTTPSSGTYVVQASTNAGSLVLNNPYSLAGSGNTTPVGYLNPIIPAGTPYTPTSSAITLTLPNTLTAGQIVNITGITFPYMNGAYTVQAGTTNASLVLDNPIALMNAGITLGAGTLDTGFIGTGQYVTLAVNALTGLAVGSIVIFAGTGTGLDSVTSTITATNTIGSVYTVTFASSVGSGTIVTAGTLRSSFTSSGSGATAVVTVNVVSTTGLFVGSVIKISGTAGTVLDGTFILTAVGNGTVSFVSAAVPITLGTSQGTVTTLAYYGSNTSGGFVTLNVSATTNINVGSIVQLATVNGSINGCYPISAVNTTANTITFLKDLIASGVPTANGTIKSAYTVSATSKVTYNVVNASVFSVGSIVNVSTIATASATLTATTAITAIDTVNNTITYDIGGNPASAAITTAGTVASGYSSDGTNGTVNVASTSTLSPGQIINISGATGLDGSYQIVSVGASTNYATTTITFAKTAAGALTAAGTVSSGFLSNASNAITVNITDPVAYAGFATTGNIFNIAGTGTIDGSYVLFSVPTFTNSPTIATLAGSGNVLTYSGTGNTTVSIPTATNTGLLVAGNFVTFATGNLTGSSGATTINGTWLVIGVPDSTHIQIYMATPPSGASVYLTGAGTAAKSTNPTVVLTTGNVAAGKIASTGTVNTGFNNTSGTVTVNYTGTDPSVNSIVNISGTTTLDGSYMITGVVTTANKKSISFASTLAAGSIPSQGTVKSGFLSSGGNVTVNVAATTNIAPYSIVNITSTTSLDGSYQVSSVDNTKLTITFPSTKAAAAISAAGTVVNGFIGDGGTVQLNVTSATNLTPGTIVQIAGVNNILFGATAYVQLSAVNATSKTVSFGSGVLSGTALAAGTIKTAFLGTGSVVTLNVLSAAGFSVGSIVNITATPSGITVITTLTAVDYVNNTISFANATANGLITAAGSATSAFLGTGSSVKVFVGSTAGMYAGNKITIAGTGTIDGTFILSGTPDATHVNFGNATASASLSGGGSLTATVPTINTCSPNASFPSVIHTHPAIQPRAGWISRPAKAKVPVFNVPSKDYPLPVAGSLPNCFTGKNTTGVFSRGGNLPKDITRYVEKHHGNDLSTMVNGRKPVPAKYQIPAGTPAHLKINDANLVKTPNM